MLASWYSDFVGNYFRLVHWDVDNENLHGAWFEEATGQHDLLAQMFTDVNQVDPNIKLFINDYMVVKGSISTVVSVGILNKIFINIDVFPKKLLLHFLKMSAFLQGADITVQELWPLILQHAH